MHCDVHYYPAKFEIKIQPGYGETEKINCIMGQNKLNSIVQGVNLTKLQFMRLFELCLYLRGGY